MPIMTAAVLLQAILANPDDDELRLVYADLLEEQGDMARAEFIRVQLALAALDWNDPHWEPLQQRHAALRKAHGEAWRAELPTLPESVEWGVFRRGFVDEVYAQQGHELLASTEQILAAIPFRRLTLVCWPAGDSLTGSPLLLRMRELALLRDHHVRTYGTSPPSTERVDDRMFEEVLAWPELTHITRLELSSPELSRVAHVALARAALPRLQSFCWRRDYDSANGLEGALDAAWLASLTSLELEAHDLAGDPLRQLCAQLTPGCLRRLTLKVARLTEADATALAGSGLLAQLELLDLCRNAIGPAGVRELVRVLPPTARLLLDDNPLGDEGLSILASSPLLARLRALPASAATVGDASALALARSPHAHRLESMALSYLPAHSRPGEAQVSSHGLEALLAAPQLQGLRELYLPNNRIESLPVCQHPSLTKLIVQRNQLSAEGLTAFCASSQLPVLSLLNLAQNRMGPKAAQALAAAQGMPALTQLLLARNPLGDAGAIALFHGSGLPALQKLDILDCGIGDAALHACMDSPLLSRLKTLNLHSDNNPISTEVYTAFCEAALQLGCDIDSWSQRLRLRPIRRTQPGAALPPEERAVLARWINRLQYAEYHTAGWLKAISFYELREKLSPSETALLDRCLQAASNDVALRRTLIRLFLSEWLVSQVPESIGVWGLNAEEFRPVERAEALALVDGIITTSLEQDARIEGMPPRYVIGADAPAKEFVVTGAEELAEISYSQLHTWFAEELFDSAHVAYFVHTNPGGPTVRFKLAQPRVLAMDRDLIGMLWLE